MSSRVEPTEPHVHCWHLASEQHNIPNHRDEVCCHDGFRRCIDLEVARDTTHGDFIPPVMKRTGREVVTSIEPPPAKSGAKVIDLMAALKESLAAKQEKP